MSHFSVLTIGPSDEKEISEVLMPFCEHTDKLPKEILNFEDHETKCKKRWDKNSKEIQEWYPDNSFEVDEDKFNEIKNKKNFKLTRNEIKNINCFTNNGGKCEVYTCIKINDIRKINKFYCDYACEDNPTKYSFQFMKEDCEISFIKIKAPKKLYTQERYANFEEYMNLYHGFSKRDETTGKYGYWVNKKAKWDWYVVGGRWDGWLLLKDGTLSNKAKKCEIDFQAMKAKSIVNAKNNWEEAKKEDKVSRGLIFGIKDDDTKESYIKRVSDVATFAVVKNGKWYEKGEMGWWACVTNEKCHNDWFSKFNDLINKTKDDEVITVVDCHV